MTTKTSRDWLSDLEPDIYILDPDGWDRRDFDFSFDKELIEKEEFYRRLFASTIQGKLRGESHD